jgi:hypothetical protein
MSRTRRKLEEATFFLEKMRSERSAHPDFDFYLSACVNAARSVTWIMRAEYLDIEGWETWFRTKEPTAEDQSLLRKLNDLRVRSVKTHPLEAKATLVFAIPPDRVTPELKESLKSAIGKKIILTAWEVSDGENEHLPDRVPASAFLTTFQGVGRQLDEFPGEDVVNVLNRYLSLLECLVAECEALFPLGVTLTSPVISVE